jgi:anti-sigma regulatory factor (Ser/Thr protein kinase)
MASTADLRLKSGEHVVYFYEDDQNLATATASYLAAALSDGGAAIAIATPDHAAAVAAELRRHGVDVDSQERAGALVFLDARATLDQFIVDGSPDADRFREVVATAIKALAPGERAVHAFGEMVGLLWDVGDVDGVIALEILWNDLLADVPFSLVCGYPATALGDGSADSVQRVCDVHSGSASPIPAPAHAEVSRTFPAAATSPRGARRFLADTLTAWRAPGDLYDDAALVVTELTVNAIKHAKSGFTVSLERTGDGMRITVGDVDPTRPARRSSSVDATSGRGLLLVDAVAAAWGSTPTPGGKLVWAELGRPAERRR